MLSFFCILTASVRLERCQKPSLVETQTFDITPNYFCPMGNLTLNIRAKVPSNVTNVFSELRFETRGIPRMRYLIDYCGNGSKGCNSKNGILKYTRRFPAPTRVVVNSSDKGYFNTPVTVRLIHHGTFDGERVHVGCVNFTTKRQERC